MRNCCSSGSVEKVGKGNMEEKKGKAKQKYIWTEKGIIRYKERLQYEKKKEEDTETIEKIWTKLKEK